MCWQYRELPPHPIYFVSLQNNHFSYKFQEHVKILHERAVAYLNVDVAVQRNFTLRGEGSPLLQEAIFNVARKVSSLVVNATKRYDGHLTLCIFKFSCFTKYIGLI